MTLLNKNINNIILKYQFTYENLLNKYNKSNFNDNSIWYIEELIVKCVNNKYIGFWTSCPDLERTKTIVNKLNLNNIINVEKHNNGVCIYIGKLRKKGKIIAIEDLLSLK